MLFICYQTGWEMFCLVDYMRNYILSSWVYWCNNNNNRFCKWLRENCRKFTKLLVMLGSWEEISEASARWQCVWKSGFCTCYLQPHMFIITVWNKYVECDALLPTCNFSPQVKTIRTKGSKFENLLVVRWIAKTFFKNVFSFPRCLTW